MQTNLSEAYNAGFILGNRVVEAMNRDEEAKRIRSLERPKGFPFQKNDAEEYRKFYIVIEKTFSSRKDHDAFFFKMPKGAETHAHNTGSLPSPKKFLDWAENLRLWFHKESFQTCRTNEETDFNELRSSGFLPPSELDKEKFMAALSVKNGVESFFRACKIGEGVLRYTTLEMRVTEIALSAIQEKILYREDLVELLLSNAEKERVKREVFTSFCIEDVEKYLAHPVFQQILAQYVTENKKLLESCDKNVPRKLREFAEQKYTSLGLTLEEVRARFDPSIPLSSVLSPITYRYILEICKTQFLDDFFIDAVCACELAVSDPERVVGVNPVGCEVDQFVISFFEEQIKVLKAILTQPRYAAINLTIHIGERQLNDNKGCFPTNEPGSLLMLGQILKVVEELSPKRLGHAFALKFESNEQRESLLTLLKTKKIFIEGCPSSSQNILGAPSPLFSEHTNEFAPHVTINSDDSLVNNSSLSNEYLNVHKDGYTVKKWGRFKPSLHHFLQWNRNGLESAFLPGCSLYKTDPAMGDYVIDETALQTGSEKAYMQNRFETELRKFFENEYRSEITKREHH